MVGTDGYLDVILTCYPLQPQSPDDPDNKSLKKNVIVDFYIVISYIARVLIFPCAVFF